MITASLNTEAQQKQQECDSAQKASYGVRDQCISEEPRGPQAGQTAAMVTMAARLGLRAAPEH